MQDKPLVCECGKPFSPGQALRCRLNEDEIGYMPRGPNVAKSLVLYLMRSRIYPTSACGHVALFCNALGQ